MTYGQLLGLIFGTVLITSLVMSAITTRKINRHPEQDLWGISDMLRYRTMYRLCAGASTVILISGVILTIIAADTLPMPWDTPIATH